ncbi:TetR/AcrR family transcriptional regulator [Desulfospira joergensenii]|uniref:TetR/AcrR family transcriptional regulator n=1 Tax=Desulfospira joergensenii TaxID=53329 RepID=UPI0003B76486|nr:helix-turn-helix domain-containing protein [Desulfospira joergensenii]
MPPKFKFTKDEILKSAFTLVRKKGWGSLTTRTLADELGSSARPIYSFFKSMDELEEELVKMSLDLLYTHMIRKRTGDPWIDHGIGYVMFAQEEKYLFRGCNNEKNIKRFKAHGDIIWDRCTRALSDYPPFRELTREQIDEVQYTRWLMAHGLAFQVSNPPPDVWDDNKVIRVMQKGSKAILDGLKKQFNSQ